MIHRSLTLSVLFLVAAACSQEAADAGAEAARDDAARAADTTVVADGATSAADGTAVAATPPCCAEDEVPAAAAVTAGEIGRDTAAGAGLAPGGEVFPDDSLYLLPTEFTDSEGTHRHLADFRGAPTVVAMVFTHCEYACPIILEDIKQVEAGVPEAQRDDINWVLISFDAERDLPEVLAAYAEKEELDPARWTLLHADAAGVRETAAVLGVRYKQTPNGSFSHSNRVTILDAEGRVATRLDGLRFDPQPGIDRLRDLLAASGDGN